MTWTTTQEPIDRRGWWAIAIACSSLVAIMLDSAGVNLAFPFIEEEFPDTSRSTLAWIPSAYWMTLAALLLPAGRWADGNGRRRAFVVGISVFALGSLLTAAAPSPGLIIGARVVQGAGSALMTATALAIALPELAPNQRAFAVGVFGTSGATAAALGPTVGALLVDQISWRAIFVVPIPIAAAAAIITPRRVRESRVDDVSRDLDPVGTGLGAVAVGTLTLMVLQLPSWGWTDRRMFGAGVILLVTGPWFIRRSATAADPLLDLSLFRGRRFLVGNLNQLATQIAIFAWFISTPLFLINVWEWSALRTGFAVAIPMVAASVSIPAGLYADRYGHRQVLIAGGLITAAGTGWWLAVIDAEPDFWSLLPGLVAFGLGAGMAGTTGTSASLHLIGDERMGSANAAHQTLRRLAQGMGPAVALTVLGSRDADGIESFRRVWWAVLTAYVISAAIGALYPRHHEP